MDSAALTCSPASRPSRQADFAASRRTSGSSSTSLRAPRGRRPQISARSDSSGPRRAVGSAGRRPAIVIAEAERGNLPVAIPVGGRAQTRRPAAAAPTPAKRCPNRATHRQRSRRNRCLGIPAPGSGPPSRRSGPGRPTEGRRCGYRRRAGNAPCCCRSTSAAEQSPSNRTAEWRASRPLRAYSTNYTIRVLNDAEP